MAHRVRRCGRPLCWCWWAAAVDGGLVVRHRSLAPSLEKDRARESGCAEGIGGKRVVSVAVPGFGFAVIIPRSGRGASRGSTPVVTTGSVSCSSRSSSSSWWLRSLPLLLLLLEAVRGAPPVRCGTHSPCRGFCCCCCCCWYCWFRGGTGRREDGSPAGGFSPADSAPHRDGDAETNNTRTTMTSEGRTVESNAAREVLR